MGDASDASKHAGRGSLSRGSWNKCGNLASKLVTQRAAEIIICELKSKTHFVLDKGCILFLDKKGYPPFLSLHCLDQFLCSHQIDCPFHIVGKETKIGCIDEQLTKVNDQPPAQLLLFPIPCKTGSVHRYHFTVPKGCSDKHFRSLNLCGSGRIFSITFFGLS